MPYYVYVLRNDLEKIYIGQTSNLAVRLNRHNGLLPSKARSYTKINRGSWKLVYKEAFSTRSDAVKREKFLKSHQGRDLIKEVAAR